MISRKSAAISVAVLCLSSLVDAQIYPNVPIPSCVQPCIQTASRGSVQNLCTGVFIESVHACIPVSCNSTTPNAYNTENIQFYTQIFDSYCASFNSATSSSTTPTLTPSPYPNATTTTVIPTGSGTVTETVYVTVHDGGCYTSTSTTAPTSTPPIIAATYANTTMPIGTGTGYTSSPTSSSTSSSVIYILPTLTSSKAPTSTSSILPTFTGAANRLDGKGMGMMMAVGVGIVAIVI